MILSQEVTFEALDPQIIRGRMLPPSLQLLERLTVLNETDSSNSALLRLPVEQQHAHAILAESQTRGRGRRQRDWYSPPGCNVYLSLGWSFTDNRALSTLPLVAAICTCRALERIGLRGHLIKWPNDILVSGAKLAGILVELQATAGGPAHAVIGIGLNVSMPEGSAAQIEADDIIDRSWTDLVSQMPGASGGVSRNDIAAALLDELLSGIRDYESAGFESFRAEWMALDELADREVRVQLQDSSISGIARGINVDGCLVLEERNPDGHTEQRIIYAGEVSVRHV